MDFSKSCLFHLTDSDNPPPPVSERNTPPFFLHLHPPYWYPDS